MKIGDIVFVKADLLPHHTGWVKANIEAFYPETNMIGIGHNDEQFSWGGDWPIEEVLFGWMSYSETAVK